MNFDVVHTAKMSSSEQALALLLYKASHFFFKPAGTSTQQKNMQYCTGHANDLAQ